MKIAFFTLFPATLKHDWYRDLIYQKVGIPNLAGYLARAGYPGITQYDFNNQVRRAYAIAPEKVRLMTYADKAAVARYLAAGEPAVGAQTEYFLDLFKVKRHDLFGLSLAGFLGDDAEIALGTRLALCLAKALKARFPGCTVLLGGMQNMNLGFLEAEYRRALKACPYIDYAVCGEAHAAVLAICRAHESGRRFGGEPDARFALERAGRGLLVKLDGSKNPAAPIMTYFRPLPAGEARNPSVPFGYPAYDPANCRAYDYTGEQVRKFYHLPAPAGARPRAGDGFLTLQVSFSEGCRFGCLFCGSAQTDFFSLGFDEAIEVLRRLKGETGCRHFLFYNPNFNPTYAYAREFLGKLIRAKLDLLWADCFNLRCMDRDLIALMREAGCVKVIAGAEYPTARMLKYINKGLTLERVNRNLEDLHKAGIWNHVLLITGLPTETWDDVRELEAWLDLTKDWVNSYTVGSFHMVEHSPFYRHPEKFGFRLKDALRLYCQSAFDEKDLKWEEKRRQNAETNRHVRDYIDRLKGSRKPTAARMDDSHLLMYLYRTCGHAAKAKIEALYEAAWTENPHIAAAGAHLGRQLARPGSALNALLRPAGLRLDAPAVNRETLSFSLSGRGAALDCSVMARDEQTLINPAANLVHGDFFALEARPADPRARARRELAALVGRLGGRLALEPARGGAAVTLSLPGGRIEYRLSPGGPKPSFTMKVFSAAAPAAAARRAGELLLESSAPPGPGAAAALRRALPGILEIAENWRS